FIDPPGAGGARSDHWMHAGGQPASDGLQVFDYSRACPIDISAIFKHHEDIRVVEHRLRAHRLHMWRSEQRRHNWVGDLVFDDVWRFTLPIGVNDDLNIGNIWQGVKGDVAEGPDSSEDQQGHGSKH